MNPVISLAIALATLPAAPPTVGCCGSAVKLGPIPRQRSRRPAARGPDAWPTWRRPRCVPLPARTSQGHHPHGEEP